MIRPCVIGLLAVTCACPALAQSSAYLYENPAWYTVRAPKSVRAVDLNADGRTDILSVGQLGEVSVRLNEGGGVMSRPDFYVSGNPDVFGIESEDVAVADLDGDTFPDFVTANLTGQSLQTFINDGSGAFTLTDSVASPTGEGFRAVAIGDVNDDGRPDLVGTQLVGDDLLLFLALPGGGYDAPISGFTINNPRQLVFGDADGDGLDDLVAVATGGLVVFLNLGFDGMTGDWLGFGMAGITNPIPSGSAEDLELSDMDGDGAIDAVVTTRFNPAIVVLGNTGGGAFATVASAPAPDGPFGLGVGDLNGDGRPDVACASFNNDGQVTVALQADGARGTVSFSSVVTFSAVNSITVDADTGDLDGDGDVDVLVGALGSQMTTALLNDGTGTFAMPTRADTDEQQVVGLIATDADSDGDQDMVSLTDIFNGPTFAQIVTNDGAGNFASGFRLDLPGRPNDTVGGDFDGDGRRDLAALDIDADRLRVVFTNSDGTLSDGGLLLSNTQTGVFEFGVLDANGDGRDDLFTNGVGINALNRSKLYLGNADRTFTEVGQTTISDQYRTRLFPFDFDTDGDMDLCAIVAPSNNVVLLTNNGNNTFSNGGSAPPTGVQFPEFIAVDDYDGDGSGDFAIIDDSAREVLVFRGDGPGFSFLPPEVYAFDARINELSASDADGDGDTDLFVHLDQGSTNDESSVYALGVLRNAGDGAFGEATAYHTFRMNRGTVFADFNGDGLLDAGVGANSPLGSVYAFLQRSETSAPACPGDCDESGSVDFGDLVAMLGEFGTPGSVVGCDADASGTVDFGDLVAALGLFGPCP